MDERRIAFMKQMDVLGAVGGINVFNIGGAGASPWDPQIIKVNKKAWEKVGLKLRVIEGPHHSIRKQNKDLLQESK